MPSKRIFPSKHVDPSSTPRPSLHPLATMLASYIRFSQIRTPPHHHLDRPLKSLHSAHLSLALASTTVTAFVIAQPSLSSHQTPFPPKAGHQIFRIRLCLFHFFAPFDIWKAFNVTGQSKTRPGSGRSVGSRWVLRCRSLL